jgi:hypothetical protein
MTPLFPQIANFRARRRAALRANLGFPALTRAHVNLNTLIRQVHPCIVTARHIDPLGWS